jgi:hypothetical protein
VSPGAGLDTVSKRKIPSPRRESNPDRPLRSLVAIPTELSRLLFNFVLVGKVPTATFAESTPDRQRGPLQ